MNGDKIIVAKDLRKNYLEIMGRISVLMNAPLKLLPQGDQLNIFLGHAIKHWGQWTLEEIELAVISNIENRNASKVEFFGTISIQFLADCLFQYQETRRKAILNDKAKVLPQRAEDNSAEAIFERNKAIWNGLLLSAKDNWEIPKFAGWSAAFNYLRESGQFDLYGMTIERMHEIKVIVQQNLKKEAQSLGLTGDKSMRGEIEMLLSDDTLVAEGRKFVIKEILQNIVNEGMNQK